MTEDPSRPLGASPEHHPALTAVRRAERLAILDVLRGFAILGILFVNVHFYSRPIYAVFRDVDRSASAVDRAVVTATTLFVSEKFFSILSVLFGIGTAILFDRASARGVPVGPVYLRRLAGLFAIGIVHALSVYSGDFIGNYAVLGVLLWWFRKANGRKLLAWSAIALLVPCLMMAQGLLARPAVGDGDRAPSVEQHERQQHRREALDRRIEESVRVYGRGTVAEIFRLRSREVVMQYSSLLFVGWKMFAMFLVGMWCWRSGLVRGVDGEGRWPGFLRKTLWVSGAVGVLGSLLSLYGETADAGLGAGLRFAAFVGQQFGAPALAVFYMTAITLLYRGGTGERWLGRLAPVGRMAMSNYVAQSLVCSTMFYSYGLGWFGRLSYGEAALLAVAVCVAQVAASAWWLARFEFGPLEWLLRRWVYGGAS